MFRESKWSVWILVSDSGWFFPVLARGHLGTVVVSTVIAVTWSGSGSKSWSCGSSWASSSWWNGSGGCTSSRGCSWWIANLFAAVVSSWCGSSSVAWIASPHDALFWFAVTDKLLATFVRLNFYYDGFFVECTALWFWASCVGALFWNADVLMTAVIDLVGHQVLVKSALWNFWAVSVKALDVASFAARANSAHITLIVPRFKKKTWAVVLVNTGWWGWGGFVRSCSGSGNTGVRWTAVGGAGLDVTVRAWD